MNNDLQDFEQFMKRREKAAQAYVSGDTAPLSRISAQVLPATFFSPKGDYRQGTDEVSSTYEYDATNFEPGGDTSFEILQMAASNGIAYWVGFQRANARMRGSSEAIPMNLRVTEVFRREGNEWKLVHRHADFLKIESESSKSSSA